MIQYIIKALLNDNSIFINDLGTFTKTYQSARFDGDTMLPPQYVVTLTVKDDQPDSTEFINLLCREKQCRITEASAEINRWVEELKTAIENNKEVEYDNFGTFSLNNKGVITFVCDHIDELNREFEGMGVVRLGDEVQEVKEEQEVNEVQEVQEVKEEMKDEEIRRLQEESEQRLREAEEKRLQEEADQRLREAEEQEKLAKEAEAKRLQEEAEQRLREAEEQERLAKEAEEKRLQEEAEQRLREAEEQERLAKEAEEKRLQEEKEDQEEQDEQEVNEVKEEQEEEVKVEDKGAGSNEKKPAKRRRKKRRSLWWLLVLLILIVLGVLGYLFRQQLSDTFLRIKMEFNPTDEEVITEEDEEVAEATATYEEVTPEEKEEKVVPEPEVYTPEEVRTTATGNYPVIRFEQGHYYVIAGSLPTEQDAVRHIKQRNLDQYEPKIVMQNGVSNLRVCIGIFDTEEEAETFAKNVNPKYWVLK